MKDESADELLAAIAELRARYPHWRLGQLIANVADWAEQSIWDIEDQSLRDAARTHLRQLQNHESPTERPIVAP